MRELRHDFRAIYSVAYDDVPTDEAIDLVLTLPWGSAYLRAQNPVYAWNQDQYQMANVMDALSVINWRLMGCPSRYKPEPVERPGDKAMRLAAAKKAKDAARRIESTRWEAV